MQSLSQRVLSMDPAELRFRMACAIRNRADHAATTIARPRWRRGNLALLLSPLACKHFPALASARASMKDGDWLAAHRALAQHFTHRSPRFPLNPGTLVDLAERVRARFPGAAAAAGARADRMLNGRYDVLGHQDVRFGTPPAWHIDPVHGCAAPLQFWTTIHYLDPRYGDHKVIWELNRHQHWLAFARAHHLTGHSRYYRAFTEQLNDWLAANPPLQGVNWASMLELGLRSLSWLWALHFFAPAAGEAAGDTFPWIVDLLVGLDRQLTQVERNLSRYFSPNTHLTGEALALYVGGRVLPELRGSERRAAIGRDILLKELERQVHADGGHAELSAHYHRYTTDFYLLALLTARATDDPAAGAFSSAVRSLSHYLRTLADDQGRLPLLGDDDGGQLYPMCGRVPSDCRDTLAAAAAVLGEPSLAVSDIPEEAFWLCGGLPLETMTFQPSAQSSTALRDSGYYVSRTSRGDHLVFDAGRHGFLNGGHAHADALSVLLTIRGRQLLIDAGTGTYTTDAELRDRFRSTALHNTVVVNGQSQSRMRGPFHWSSVAVARASVWRSEPTFDYAEGYHDGYHPTIHARGVLSLHGFGWIVLDHLIGSGQAHADTFWHIHPDWTVSQNNRAVLFRQRHDAVVLAGSDEIQVLSGPVADEVGLYAPIYGDINIAGCARASLTGPLPRTALTLLMPTSARAAERGVDVRVDTLPVTDVAPDGWHGAGFRLTTPSRQLVILSAVPTTPDAAGDGPARVWGCSDAHTDGRLAIIDLSEPGIPALVIAGSIGMAAPALASSVHPSASTCA